VETPERPFCAILGGAKVSDKIKVIENLLTKVDSLIIGGGMAYTFLKAQGFMKLVNHSWKKTSLSMQLQMLESAKAKGVELLLPVDHLVAAEFSADAAGHQY
jgi:phosphoglycerate kinase